MTTAARPTFDSARGGNTLRDSQGSAPPSLQYSSKDQPGHTKLKLRQFGQYSVEEMKQRNLKGLKNESASLSTLSTIKNLDTLNQLKILNEKVISQIKTSPSMDKDDPIFFSSKESPHDLIKKFSHINDENEIELQNKYIDEEEDNIEKNGQYQTENDDDDDDDISEEDEGVEDEEDEEELLRRELEKIREEREQEKIRQEQLRLAQEKDLLDDDIKTGNPLLNQPRDFRVKRRWDDDVVFKNQANKVEEKSKKRFINDLVRSDFHRKFMERYIK